MAHVSLIPLTAASFIGDNDAQLVAGDVAALNTNKLGRSVFSFDPDNEMAIVSGEIPMPGQYAGGVLTADIYFFMESDNTRDIALDVFVEAKTPNSDTLDMETASSWDSANSGTVSLVGSTASDPLMISITLTNKDSVAAGDLVRFGIRRDTDSGNDDALELLFLAAVDIWETV